MARNRITYVSAGTLKIHPAAQRKLVPAQLNRRMADLDLDAIGVLHGVEIDGDIYIIDGQHRVIALQRHGFGEWRVQVMLHPEAVDTARAHALFLRLNARTTPGAYDTFLNEVGAGDEVAVGVKTITERFGLKLDRQSGDGYVSCPTALKKVYRMDNGATLSDFYEVAIAAYGTTDSAFEGKFIEGVALVLHAHNGSLDRPAFIKKLSKYPGGAAGIIGDAKGLKKIRRGSLPRCVAETVIEAYNLGRREGNKLPLP